MEDCIIKIFASCLRCRVLQDGECCGKAPAERSLSRRANDCSVVGAGVSIHVYGQCGARVAILKAFVKAVPLEPISSEVCLRQMIAAKGGG